MTSGRFVRVIVAAVFGWAVVAVGGVMLVDPYGVSPLRLSVPRFNAHKPKRTDIDRIIKPYEVWRYQPKTVFVGTSRIHQGFDPAALDGTRFAPAYNASIPASPIAENEAHLRQFFELDNNLKIVIAELFFYAFTPPQTVYPRKTKLSVLHDTILLFVSTSAVYDSVATVSYNAIGRRRPASVLAGGYWVPPEPVYSNFSQSHNINYIMKAHRSIPDMMAQPTAFESLDRIVELCRSHGVELFLVVTPNYPLDDYRLLSLRYWHRIEEWMRQISRYRNVLSFSQSNAITEEPTSPTMRWWYDPIHFNAAAGNVILRLLAGETVADAPENMMRLLTPSTVDAVLKERRDGMQRWIQRNPYNYVTEFEQAKFATGNDKRPAH